MSAFFSSDRIDPSRFPRNSLLIVVAMFKKKLRDCSPEKPVVFPAFSSQESANHRQIPLMLETNQSKKST
jgi:hypothetical protein